MPKFKRRFRKKGGYLKRQVGKNRAKIKLLSQAIEYKYYDLDVAADGCDTAGASHVLNPIQQGDSVSMRTGDRVLCRRVTVRGAFLNVNGTPADCIVRMLILKARDQNNTKQTLAHVLQDGPSAIYSMIFDQHKHRFQILADKTLSLDTTTHSMIPFYFTHKCKSVCTYNANAGAATDIEDGGYYVMFYGTAAAGANAPTVSFTSRFYYMDA